MSSLATPTCSELFDAISELRREAIRLESTSSGPLAGMHPDSLPSARNLLHYLAMRRHDVRELQPALSELGLSSLGRLEAHTLASLEAILARLHTMLPEDYPRDLEHQTGEPLSVGESERLLARHTAALLGPKPEGREVRVMVTMPAEAATDPRLVHDLLAARMNVARINCAHDGPAVWRQIIRNLRQAEIDLGRRCVVLMDLAGPKLRTGLLSAGPRVARLRRFKDERGLSLRPGRVWVTSRAEPSEDADAVMPVDSDLVAAARRGDTLRFVETSGRKRRLEIVSDPEAGSLWAESVQGAFWESGLEVELYRLDELVATSRVGPLPPLDRRLRLAAGDTLLLTRTRAGDDHLEPPATAAAPALEIPCTLDQVFEDARVGHRIFFDDGKIGGTIVAAGGEHLEIRIELARGGCAGLGSEKGINLPDTDLRIPALTAKDLGDLDFVARHADVVGLSFVQRPSDVTQLHDELERRGAPHLGIVLKIETRLAFENLPQLLLAALRSPPAGVMVARGDLGIELGMERLAEVQEEILWLAEAAHLPVIWATQVLESLAKDGLPSRAEVTDAAMGVRAECVMLNKGPHIVETVRFLCDVLRRMQAHQHKKTAMLRRLDVSVNA